MSEQKVSAEHQLQSNWSFWFDQKKANKQSTFSEGLQLLGSFNTVEEFWRFYVYLLKPSQLPKNVSIHMFRNKMKPMWEEYPNGGCWIVKLKKHSEFADRLWEQLCFACIGEIFEDPDVCGVVFSNRKEEDVVSIWNADNANTTVRFRIGEKLKQILQLTTNTIIEYKSHAKSIKDKSTYKNAELYKVPATPLTTNAGPLGHVMFGDVPIAPVALASAKFGVESVTSATSS
eukprot:TRINITY_DN551_c0_g1_i1.p1 TRINITY_DN551_c0_g1~~TRINITY_DN551_c0_g1_i1.p1  ORF type:complete len:231 (+),score=86.91 TRINITY_DN551_c0_g1_i1:99-791(+)